MTEEVDRQESPTPPPTAEQSGLERHVPDVPEPLPDDRNPAIRDARRAFLITLASIVLFAAFVVLFVL